MKSTPSRFRPRRRHWPVLRNLVFWGTAHPRYIVPQNDWARGSDSGSDSMSIIYPDDAETAFFGNTDFTVATWVKPTNTSAHATQSPYSQWNWNGLERKFCFINNSSLLPSPPPFSPNSVGFFVCKVGIGNQGITTSSKMLDGNWYRLVGIHKMGLAISFYVNNQFVGSVPWIHGVETGHGLYPQQPWLGGISAGGINFALNEHWRGHIGPTCYYNRVWMSQEVAWDYNGGRGRRYSELGHAGTDGESLLDDLVAFWQLTEEDTRGGLYSVRRDSHTGRHDLTKRIGGFNPVSVAGVLPKVEPIADDERIHQLTDRSPQGNSIVQPDHAFRPYWDAQSRVISIEPGAVFTKAGFTGLPGRQLSLYLVSILTDSTENKPWLHLSAGGSGNTGLRIYRENERLKVKAWIGGSARELSYHLSYPAERLLELHYNGYRLSLWENGQQRASVVATGGFANPLSRLDLGPGQGLKELLIYNEAHR